ncbi:MAG: NADH-quinone oxidoreductase subunit N [Candidatus Omnitrophica bacterium]|nr:NADH-quinone oxidoreductase subunit N [Candidatus Omnitrophota bacterium]
MMPSHFFYLLPEIWVGALALLILLLDLRWKGRGHTKLGLMAAIGLLPVLPLLCMQRQLDTLELLHGMYRIDSAALLFKGIFIITSLLVILMTREISKTPAAAQQAHGEFYLLILSATLGMMFVASAADFLMLFIALELITISFYVMTAYLKTDLRSLEAGIKYLILGSIASACFLYGVAFVYGSSGSIRFVEIRQFLQETPFSAGCLFGLFLILGGILFKTAGVPFQLWTPDVYEGAPTSVTAFLSVGSKSAGFLVALRVFHELFISSSADWAPVLVWVAGLTILYGNLGAIPQKNIKRLLGYSSIGHAGYLLIGLACPSSLGSTAMVFYLAGYLVTNLAVFLVVTVFSSHTGSDEIKNYAGLSKRSPLLAMVMFIALLSLAGVPPLAGFIGKFMLLLGALSQGHLTLAIIGAVAVVISLYYYLIVVKVMYVDRAEDSSPVPVSLPMRLALLFCLLGILGIGIWQEPFLSLSFAAVKGLF